MTNKIIWGIVILVIASLVIVDIRLSKRPTINFQGKSYEVVKVWNKYVVSDNSVYMQVKEIK